MNEHENFEFTVEITDAKPAARSGTFGNLPKRLPLGAKLLAVWSGLFGLVAGVPLVLFMALVGDDFGAGAVVICALIFAGAHTAASAASFKRYKRKYGVSAWQFVLLCALPLLALGAVSYITAWAVGGWDALFFAIFALSYGGYAVVYGVLLSAVLGIMHAALPHRKRGKNKTNRLLPRRRRGSFQK